MKLTLVRAFSWLLVALLIVGIFGFSSQDSGDSHDVSKVVTAFILDLAGRDYVMDSPDFLRVELRVRKAAHGSIYCLLAIMTLLALITYPLPKWIRTHMAFTLCSLTAFFDEWNQTVTPGRYGLFGDVGIDMLGAALGMCAFWIVLYFIRRERRGRWRKPRAGGRAGKDDGGSQVRGGYGEGRHVGGAGASLHNSQRYRKEH